MPAISIVLPTHNRHVMLREAIASVQQQTFTDWELIVIGDGATAETQQAVLEFADPRIRYIYQEHTGLPGARNTGIRASQGRFINLLDDDDAFLPHKLEHQIALYETDPNLGLVAGGFIETDRFFNARREVRPWLWQPTLTVRDWLLACPFNPSTPLLSRTWLDKIGLFDPDMHGADDWDVFLRLAQHGCPMVWLQEPVCYYRFHGSNMTQDVALMNSGIFKMLQKFFAQPDLPAEIINLHDTVYASAYVGAAARAFGALRAQDGREYLRQALELDPMLLSGTPPRWLDSLAAFALTPLVDDPMRYADVIATNLPEAANARLWTNSRIRGVVHAVAAFDQYEREKYDEVVTSGIQALKLDRAWLRNRGFCSIVIRSLARKIKAML